MITARSTSREIIALNVRHSTQSKRPSKVKKTRPDFPLTLHPSGRWCKKTRGKIHYFGHDPLEAENPKLRRKRRSQRPLGAMGVNHRPNAGCQRDLVNKFMEAKDAIPGAVSYRSMLTQPRSRLRRTRLSIRRHPCGD